MLLKKEEKLARLRLSRSDKVGISTFWQLIKLYGTAERAIKALPTLSESSSKFSYKVATEEEIYAEAESMKSIGGRFVFFEDELYPPQLRMTPDAPPVLSFLGNKDAVISGYTNNNMISVVGGRNASIHSNKFCHVLCEELGKNQVIIVSGLARGIDTSAHTASLETGTIAILAGGINIVYPQENTKLYNKILQNGGVFAEMPYNTSPQPQLFPRRNRIIAGMSSGTIVVEAAQESGSLITARMALEYGRDVFAVPGSPLDSRCEGSNALIQDGAILIQNAKDVLKYLENKKVICNNSLEDANELIYKVCVHNSEQTRKRILESLSSVPITIDELISCIKVSPQEVLIALLELELSDKIVRLHGQRVCLALDIS